MLSRRSIIALLALGTGGAAAGLGFRAAGPAAAGSSGAGTPDLPPGFHPARLRELAALLSRQPFGTDWRGLSGDLLSAVDAAPVDPGPTGFRLVPISAGEVWDGLTDVFLVDPEGAAWSGPSDPEAMGGFALTSPAGADDPADASHFEFRGASVFRVRGGDQVAGAAARGLAIRTADPAGEEIPVFRAIWVERMPPGSPIVAIHALLDSASVTGAYRFTLRPAGAGGGPVLVDVDAVLTPRVDLASVGLAPLTATYLFSGRDGRLMDDWRTAVHDAAGLSMLNGRGERLWRPLSNPRDLQISAFADPSPRAFGLVQRDRRFAAYQDPDGAFERRPSLMVEPIGDWGPGWVTLVEIPSGSESNDNIIALWRPQMPLAAGQAHRFTYRLSTVDEPTGPKPSALVVAHRSGAADGPDGRTFVVDYRLADPALATAAKASVWASLGTVDGPVLQVLEPGLVRSRFTVRRPAAALVELRADLFFDAAPPAEVWLHRWT